MSFRGLLIIGVCEALDGIGCLACLAPAFGAAAFGAAAAAELEEAAAACDESSSSDDDMCIVCA